MQPGIDQIGWFVEVEEHGSSPDHDQRQEAHDCANGWADRKQHGIARLQALGQQPVSVTDDSLRKGDTGE
jgi:hypothetical protein